MAGRAYRLKRTEPAAGGLRRIAVACATEAAVELRRVGRGKGGEREIHTARKDLKKVRAVLRLARGSLGEDLYRSESLRYREAGRALSATRDAQVKMETLESLLSEFDVEASQESIDEWGRALELDEEAAGERARSRGGESASAAIELIEEGRRWIEAWPLEDDSWSLVESGLARAYGRGREAMRSARRRPVSDDVHEWRKRAKDLWYQLRILESLWPEAMAGAAQRLHDLNDLLGDHNDLAVLREDLEGRDLAAPDKARLEAAIAARQRQLLSAALDLGRRIYAEKPKAHGRRIRAYWVAAGRPD